MSVSVLIPTMPGRESTLSRLLHVLEPHVGDSFEVLVHRAVAPMGAKLTEMFGLARMSHVVCVDDDDILCPGLIPGGVEDGVDFVGWKILVMIDGRIAGAVEHRFGQDPIARWTGPLRGVSPKCLVRTAIARTVPFGDEYTDDRVWSAAVQAKVSSAAFVDEFVYTYDHWESSMLGTNPGDRPAATRRDVGTWPYDPEAFTWLG